MASYANIIVRVIDAQKGVELSASEVDFTLSVSKSNAGTQVTFTALATPGTTAYNKAASSQTVYIWGGQIPDSKYMLVARSIRLERQDGTVLISDNSCYNEGGHSLSEEKKYTGTKTNPLVFVYTVYVRTGEKSRTLYFDTRGGSLKDDEEKYKTVTIGQPLGDLPTPTLAGATFKGWYYAWWAMEQFKVTKDSVADYFNTGVLVASWSSDSSTTDVRWPSSPGIPIFVKLDPNGGTVNPTLYEGKYLGYYDLPTPTRSNATFLGWFYSRLEGRQFTSEDQVSSCPDTLYAHWLVTAYTVSWMSDGASFATTTCTVGSTYVLPSSAPTKAGYTFAGWFTSASGGTQVTASTAFSATSATTLYAHWTAKAYTVSWMSDGASFATTTCTVGSTYVLPSSAPTKAGYTFAGWFTSASGGTQVTASTAFSATSATTLYAHWTAKSPSDPVGDGTGLMVRSVSADFLVFSASSGALVYDSR